MPPTSGPSQPSSETIGTPDDAADVDATDADDKLDPAEDSYDDQRYDDDDADSAVRRLFQQWGRLSTIVILAMAAVVLLLIGGTAGFALRGTDTPAPTPVPGTGSVDVGFAQDMLVHHAQGVLMAHLAEEQSTDAEVKGIAYDIEYTQTAQIGQMQGWLALWGQPETNSGPHMTWMTALGHQHGGGASDPLATSGLMPGMASPAEMAKLQTLRGKASDIFFLQLMIRHHEGGGPMMQYAQQQAMSPVVRNFAKQMLVAQTGEIGVMTQMLQLRGAQPLPFTAPTLPTG